MINYFTNRIPSWGWRLSLGLAAVPAAIVVLGALFVPDTPSSMVLRGKPDTARASLQRIRGPGVDVEPEFKDIVRAVEAARRNDEGAYARLRGEGYRHYLVMALAIPAFFDLTGVIAISVFSPVLFRTIGFSSQHAVFGSVMLSLVNLGATFMSSFVVDRAGRRFMFFAGGAAMITCQVPIRIQILLPNCSIMPSWCSVIKFSDCSSFPAEQYRSWPCHGYWRTISGSTKR